MTFSFDLDSGFFRFDLDSGFDIDFGFVLGPARLGGVNSDFAPGDESHDPPEVEPPKPPPPPPLNCGGLLGAWKLPPSPVELLLESLDEPFDADPDEPVPEDPVPVEPMPAADEPLPEADEPLPV